MNEALLVFGMQDTASLRHEVPPPTLDPVLFIEIAGDRHVFCDALRVPLMDALDGVRVTPFDALGEEAVGTDDPYHAATIRACRRLAIGRVLVPTDLPIGLAEALRTAGIVVLVDGPLFARRRRGRSGGELQAVRRALRAAEAAMEEIRARLRTGAATTSDELRTIAWREFADHGCGPAPKLTIACGPQAARMELEGSGPVHPHQPILVDVFPREVASGCWGDLTRTMCVGEPPTELVRWHAVVREVQQATIAAIRPGVTGDALNAIAESIFAAEGYATGPEATVDDPARARFPHLLGHGLGLELHEPPFLAAGGGPLVEGDVVTVEPGLYRTGFGGLRLEDVVLVTATGSELLTDSPYDLTP